MRKEALPARQTTDLVVGEQVRLIDEPVDIKTITCADNHTKLTHDIFHLSHHHHQVL